jgi:hypothetical protein
MTAPYFAPPNDDEEKRRALRELMGAPAGWRAPRQREYPALSSTPVSTNPIVNFADFANKTVKDIGQQVVQHPLRTAFEAVPGGSATSGLMQSISDKSMAPLVVGALAEIPGVGAAEKLFSKQAARRIGRASAKELAESAEKFGLKGIEGKRLELMDTPEVVKERIANAWKRMQEPLPPPPPKPLGILDRRMIELDPGPSTAPLPERRQFGPRAGTSHVAGLYDPENAALTAAQVERGMKIMPNTFYPSYKAVEHAVANAGGDSRMFNAATTASAIRSGVEGELMGGTGLLWALKKGIISLDELAEIEATKGVEDRFQPITERVRKAAQEHVPDANLLQLMGAHTQALHRRLAGVETDAYKIPQYGAQKAANVPGFVLDTHESRGGTLGSPFHRVFAGKGFEGPEYGAQEQMYRQLAKRMGLSDRAFQEARWRGGGNITGLETAPNKDYAQIFEELLNENARYRGMKPEDLLPKVAQGETFLYRRPAGAR